MIFELLDRLSRRVAPVTVRPMAAEFGPPPAVAYPELARYSDAELMRRDLVDVLAEIRADRARRAAAHTEPRERPMRRRIEYTTRMVVEEEYDDDRPAYAEAVAPARRRAVAAARPMRFSPQGPPDHDRSCQVCGIHHDPEPVRLAERRREPVRGEIHVRHPELRQIEGR